MTVNRTAALIVIAVLLALVVWRTLSEQPPRQAQPVGPEEVATTQDVPVLDQNISYQAGANARFTQTYVPRAKSSSNERSASSFAPVD